jgi:tripeptide aminopeptidase
MDVIDRFLRYVKIHTTSDESSSTHPSTQRQFDLARLLKTELDDMGIEALLDESCCVYAHIPANNGSKRVTGFISHLDTSPEASGENVSPRIVESYDGTDIKLCEGVILSPQVFPEMLLYKGQDLIVTDGTTLLGSDDKSGIAEIMAMAEYFVTHPEVKHGGIAIAFTPDEEIGAGTDHFDLDKFGADYAYTVDGGQLGEIQYECFNAASVKLCIHGKNVHTGEAKGKMINAVRIACEFESMLPREQKPEFTEGYEGFFHLLSLTGDASYAQASYLIRDHSREKFEEKKALVNELCSYLSRIYGKDTVVPVIRDTYFNMRSVIDPDYMFLVEKAAAVMEELGIKPITEPIRGGTDGASLSFKGLPCPNLCAGGHNFHGIYEYVPIQSMRTITEMLIRLCK